MKHKLSMKQKLVAAVLRAMRFPVIPAAPKKDKWYRIPLPDCAAADGGPYHGSICIGTENKVMVVFHGGGVSWNEYMAARPSSLFYQPDTVNFYAVDSDLVADLATGHGIASRKKSNPFRNWSVICIPYSSGDFHCGTNDYPYRSIEGERRICRHHGYTNYRAVMEKAMHYIGGTPDQLMVTGFSAGGFGTALLTDDVMSLFPDCKDVICYVDSSFMRYPGWREAAENVWKAPRPIYERLHTDDITLDSLQALKANHGDKVKTLFSCSVRDAALAEYIPFVADGKFYVDKQAGITFQHDLAEMCRQMMETIPNAGLYLFDMPVAGKASEKKRADGLTQHCIGLSGLAETVRIEGKTVQEWVWNAVNGKVERIGLPLLEQFPDE